MQRSIRRLSFATLTALASAPLWVSTAAAQAPTPGERWRSTMSMEMMGMKIPGQATEICSPKGASQAPVADDKECQVTNRRRSGNTESFDMACKGGMTGTMEMTQESPTRWSGKMLANTKEGQMTMRMASEKLPGECDASAIERKMNQMAAQGEAAVAKQCMESAKAVQTRSFLGANAMCKDAPSIKTFCGSAQTSVGYNTLARQQRMGSRVYTGAEAAQYRTILADTGKLCSFSPETVRKQYCGTAQQKADWTFFAEECPELSKPLAQAQCAGRDFTTPVAPQWVKFCSAWSAAGSSVAAAGGSAGAGDDNSAATTSGESRAAGDGAGGAQQADPQKPTPADKAKDAMQKSKDALKGLFGR